MTPSQPSGSRGDRLRQAREQQRLSLRDLAEIVGVPFNTLARIERGQDCLASAADAIDAWLGEHDGTRDALMAADSILSEVGYRYGSLLPDEVHRDCIEASTKCRRALKEGQAVAAR